MGQVASELKQIVKNIDNTREKINGKYEAMDIQPLSDLSYTELPGAVDKIPVLNTKDGTITPDRVLDGEIGYSKGQKVVGSIPKQDTHQTIQSGETFKIPKGYHEASTVTAQSLSNATIDADATVSDIAKDKTAYVKGRKITGSLPLFNGVSDSAHYNKGTGMSLKLTDGIYKNCTFNLTEKDLAVMLGITSDVIKKGSVVCGVTGTYQGASIAYPGIGFPELEDEQDPDSPNYSVLDSKFDIGIFNNWGLYEIRNDTKLVEGYVRIYNALHYNGTKAEFHYVDFNTKQVSEKVYPGTLNGKKYCYLQDIGLTVDEVNYLWGIVREDNPELMSNWYKTYSYGYSGNVITAISFENFEESTRQQYLSRIQSTFNQICNIIKSTYGINMPSGNYIQRAKALTPLQKLRVSKVIHDFLVQHNYYASSELDQTMYPAMSDGLMTPVCASYGKAFLYCCKRWGILAFSQFGTAGGKDARHLWNLVSYQANQYDESGALDAGKWCELDVTWADNSVKYDTYITWKYYNIPTVEMMNYYNANDDGVKARLRGYKGVTQFNNEIYKSAPANCNNTSNRYTGNKIYGW